MTEIVTYRVIAEDDFAIVTRDGEVQLSKGDVIEGLREDEAAYLLQKKWIEPITKEE